MWVSDTKKSFLLQVWKRNLASDKKAVQYDAWGISSITYNGFANWKKVTAMQQNLSLYYFYLRLFAVIILLLHKDKPFKADRRKPDLDFCYVWIALV